jgi:hypothetical protein
MATISRLAEIESRLYERGIYKPQGKPKGKPRGKPQGKPKGKPQGKPEPEPESGPDYGSDYEGYAEAMNASCMKVYKAQRKALAATLEDIDIDKDTVISVISAMDAQFNAEMVGYPYRRGPFQGWA